MAPGRRPAALRLPQSARRPQAANRGMASPCDLADLARVNASFIALLEKRAVAAILPAIPAWTLPIHLTVLAFAGAVLTAVALIACTWWPAAVVFVPLGLFVHWFGDSLDGSLARYRRIERPAFGFFVDHVCDLFGLSLVIVAFGLSPFLSLVSALLVLTMYLLFSAYTYVKVTVAGIHQLAYGGLGCTEFRLLMAGWSIFAALAGPDFVQARFHGIPKTDWTIGLLSAAAFCYLLNLFLHDLPGIDLIDRAHGKGAPAPAPDREPVRADTPVGW